MGYIPTARDNPHTFSHHAKLPPNTHRRRAERKSREKKQYESILQMVDVSFQPNGQMLMTPFMEGFPFPFYVVVNSLEEVCLVGGFLFVLDGYNQQTTNNE